MFNLFKKEQQKKGHKGCGLRAAISVPQALDPTAERYMAMLPPGSTNIQHLENGWFTFEFEGQKMLAMGSPWAKGMQICVPLNKTQADTQLNGTQTLELFQSLASSINARLERQQTQQEENE